MLEKLFRRSEPVSSAAPAMHMVQLPVAVQTSTRLFIAALILSALALLFAPWQQTSVAGGRVIAYTPQERTQAIEAPIKGRIIKWHVQEGEAVTKGQTLVELGDNDPQYRARLVEQRDALVNQRRAAEGSIEEFERRVESLKQVRELTLESMNSKIRMANFEVQAAQRALKGARGESKAAELNFDRKQKLAAQGLASQRDLELSEAKATKTDAEVSKARAKLAEKRSKVLALKAERESKANEIDAKLAEVRSKLQDLRSKLAKAQKELSEAEVKVAQVGQMTVTAARDGIVLEIEQREGSQFVKPGDQLALLVPTTTSRAVELWISGNDAPLVEPGRKVRLQFEGWPAVQFSGWPSVAVGTFGGQIAFVDARAEKNGLFRVVVLPDPDDEPWPTHHILRQGGRANGWILLNEVRLGYELWRLLNGFPPALPEEAVLRGESGKYSPGKAPKRNQPVEKKTRKK